MNAEKANHKVTTMCRLLGVSTSGYYAWEKRTACLSLLEDEALIGLIFEVHERSRKTYGAPRIHFELAEEYGARIGRKRVARLMREQGIYGCHRRKLRGLTKKDPHATLAPDLLDRNFTALGPIAHGLRTSPTFRLGGVFCMSESSSTSSPE